MTRNKAARYLKPGEKIGGFEIEHVEHYTEPGRAWWGGKVDVPMVFVSGISYLFGNAVEDWSRYAADALVTYTP